MVKKLISGTPCKKIYNGTNKQQVIYTLDQTKLKPCRAQNRN